MDEKVYLLKNPEDGSVLAHVVFYAKKCPMCNKGFQSKTKQTLYCSEECRNTANKNKRKALAESDNKSKKFQKNTKCQYCEEKMEAKYRSKRFCSPKCRVYFGREKGKKVEKKEVYVAPPPIKKEENSFLDKMRNKKLGI